MVILLFSLSMFAVDERGQDLHRADGGVLPYRDPGSGGGAARPQHPPCRHQGGQLPPPGLPALLFFLMKAMNWMQISSVDSDPVSEPDPTRQKCPNSYDSKHYPYCCIKNTVTKKQDPHGSALILVGWIRIQEGKNDPQK